MKRVEEDLVEPVHNSIGMCMLVAYHEQYRCEASMEPIFFKCDRKEDEGSKGGRGEARLRSESPTNW